MGLIYHVWYRARVRRYSMRHISPIRMANGYSRAKISSHTADVGKASKQKLEIRNSINSSSWNLNMRRNITMIIIRKIPALSGDLSRELSIIYRRQHISIRVMYPCYMWRSPDHHRLFVYRVFRVPRSSRFLREIHYISRWWSTYDSVCAGDHM